MKRRGKLMAITMILGLVAIACGGNQAALRSAQGGAETGIAANLGSSEEGSADELAAADASGEGTSSGGQTTGSSGRGSGSTGTRSSGNGGATDIGVTATEIKIGGVWFHESYLDKYSRVVAQAVQAYFSEVNKAGGIHGRKIVYKSCSDGGDATRSVGCFKQLVEQDKVFMLGPSASWYTGSIQEQVKTWKIPFVGSFGLYLEEFENDNKYSFPAQVPVYEIARLMGKFIVEEVKPKTVAISYLNIKAAQECMAGVEKYLKDANIPVVAKASNEFDEASMDAQVIAIRKENPELVIFCNDPVNNAKFVGVAAANQGYRPPKGWIGGWPTVPDFTGLVGNNGVGHYGFSSVCYHEAAKCDADPDVKLFKSQLAKYYPGSMNKMHYYGQNLWCGSKMIVEALQAAGPNLTRSKFLEVMDSGKFNGWKCQGMEFFYKAGSRSGSRSGMMMRIDPGLKWVIARDVYKV